MLRELRTHADTLTAGGRGRLLYEAVRAIYDSEKMTGAGGEGIDGRDSAARRSIGEVADRAAQVSDDLIRAELGTPSHLSTSTGLDG